MILSPQQRRVLDELVPVTRIATDGSREGLPIMPRCHSMIVGPSGSGKSHVAREIARTMNLPCLVINVATWVIIAARSEPWTWTVICEWLNDIECGVLVLDEADKLTGDSDWGRYARLEIHDLLDGIVPASAKLPDVSDGEFHFETPSFSTSHIDRATLAKRLRERVMVIGCGAWQSAWRENARPMGFSTGAATQPEPPTREQILGSINAELRQRFRDEVSLLPPMSLEDYETVAQTIITRIPMEFRQEWRNHLGAALGKAFEGTLGMRVFEELLLMAMVLSRGSQKADTPRPKPDRELRLI
ncbi:MAG: ATP-binding protein [Luteolibacter sp.]